jgi:pimeloyl-ACP methyl ester carboxylesterase
VSDSSLVGDQRIQLPDGRRLGYKEYGDPSGKPVLLFPGMPSSRLLHPPEEPLQALGVRLLVIERPGFGFSDYQARRTLLDWPDDVLGFTESLGIERFAVVGISAGGPYAAVCAYRISHRLSGAAIVSGVGPVDVPGGIEEMPRIRQAGARVARRAPWLLRPLLWLVSNPQRDPERFYERMLSGNSDVDRAILTRPDIKAMLMDNYQEATRMGVRGFAREAAILSNAWAFRIEEITMPVWLWHGEEDANVSLSAARYLAQTIPQCHAKFLPGEGHWLFLKRWQEIVAPLI